MEMRCPNAKIVGKGYLSNYRLLFKGSKTGSYLTIEPAEKEEVPFGIWEITPKHEETLDIYEGYPLFYYKRELDIEYYDFESKTIKKDKAMVYIMHEDREFGIPTRRYMDVCQEGYSNFGFNHKYLAKAYLFSKNGGDYYDNK